MSLSKQSVKGTRDFYPEDKRKQDYMFSVWRKVCAQFGYEEYHASVLEPIELYAAKSSEELVQEQTYSFEDRGGRKLTLRPEITPTLARMVAAKQQELGYPLRMHAIPNCFRYERMQRGRTREFWQPNADLIGVEGIEGDVEIIHLADSVLKAFGAHNDQYEIRVNTRVGLGKIIEKSKPKVTDDEVLKIIDKSEKISQKELESLLNESVLKPEVLLAYLQSTKVPENLIDLFDKLEANGVDSVVYSPTTVRGLDYYTDIVFEVFDKHPDNNRAMFGGGRYDGLIELFGAKKMPAVGFAIGDSTLENFLDVHGLIPELSPATQVFVIPLAPGAHEVVSKLRGMGVNVAVDIHNSKLEKSFKNAEKHGIPYALVVGENELKSGDFELKNLKTGEKTATTLKGIADTVLS